MLPARATSHVSTLAPLRLNRLPGIFGGPCGGGYIKTRNVRAVQSDVPPRKLILKDPFVKRRRS
jgi:hypothetical protein